MEGVLHMHLNIDCVRDILLTVETNDFGNRLTLTKLCEKIPNYTQDEIHYACLKLYEGEYLELIALNILGHQVPAIKSINDLTFKGHEFLASIKVDSNWNKTKDVAKKVGSFSLNTLKDISAQVIAEVIKKSF